MGAPSNNRRAKQLQIEIFRRMTPAQRFDCALRWTALTNELARSAIRTEHPDWSAARVERELGRRITGIDVTKLDWERVLRQQAELEGTPPDAEEP